ncbi:MAG: aminopeptidase [Ruminococcaceae bacterium]|nr:aminopeptidase [Oscillospiraceae bacterium]
MYKAKSAYEVLSEEEINKAYNFCEDYKKFLDSSKTERMATDTVIAMAKKNGFNEFEYDREYKSGDKVYFNNRGKAVILAVIGKKSVDNGVNIAAAHIDCPRIDLKPNPLYEDSGFAFFKTHYYGGIKKYQWTTIPLALHGVVSCLDGRQVEISIGEDENDPVFYISDLLPHLGTNQMTKPMHEAIPAETLNIILGTRPTDSDSGEKIKENIMKLINEKYGITERDFTCAEISAVPTFKARDVGFDRSLIAAYGHDDRVCAYPQLMAILEADMPEKTLVSVFADKEETGSDGNTGLQSNFLYDFIVELANSQKVNPRKALNNSKCLSADVNACFDPDYADAYEKRNAAFINNGVVLTKYTGSRGKSGTSDASAEYIGQVARAFEKGGALWQTAELGKTDLGGGGTVAKYVANLNVDTVDIGVAVVSMHAPYELVSKTDVYMTYKAVKAFFEFI